MLIAAEEVEALVDGNAGEPGEHLRVGMEAVEPVPGLEECVLKHIVGIIVRQDNTAYLPIQLFAVLAHHLTEGTTLCLGIQKLSGKFAFVCQGL